MRDQLVTAYDEVHDRICAALASLPQQQCLVVVPVQSSRPAQARQPADGGAPPRPPAGSITLSSDLDAPAHASAAVGPLCDQPTTRSRSSRNRARWWTPRPPTASAHLSPGPLWPRDDTMRPVQAQIQRSTSATQSGRSPSSASGAAKPVQAPGDRRLRERHHDEDDVDGATRLAPAAIAVGG